MSEASRAAEYRRMMQAREDNRAARERALVGSADALEQLKAKTEALLPDRGWDPDRKVREDVAGYDL